MNKLAVLSRYKENNNFWTEYLKQYGYDILIFNKFSGDNLLPNVGREGHTFIYYIVNNYDSLPDEILFSQFAPMDHFNNFPCPLGYKGTKHMDYFLNGYIYDFIGIRPHDFRYKINNSPMHWLDFLTFLYDKTLLDNEISRLLCCGTSMNGVFRTTAKAIKRHPKIFYEKILSLLSTSVSPRSGYFFEFMWKFIFTNYCNNTLKTEFNNNIFLFGCKLSNDLGTSLRKGYYGHIFLSDYGAILSTNNIFYTNINETHWSIESDNIIRFFRSDGALTSSFVINDIFPLIGNHYVNNDLILGDVMLLGNKLYI